MNFYTNVTQWGNFLLLREVVNGERLVRKVKYSPTLYAPVAKPTEYKTLEGKYVTPIKHNTIKEAREWLDSYKQKIIDINKLHNNIIFFLYNVGGYPFRHPYDFGKSIDKQLEGIRENIQTLIELI